MSLHPFALLSKTKTGRLTDRLIRNAYYTPHAHDGLTTLLILSGDMTIKFGEDVDPEKKTYGAGSRIDVAAGRQHEVWIGDKGCTSVIGE